jgi:ABC-type Na+ efflux pump permease subunit
MNFFRLLPVILSFLLLGAHFYRAGLTPMTYLCVAALGLLFLRQSWVPRLFQVLLVLGAIEWLRSLYFFVAMRIAWDQPWTRLAVILCTVALLTALSGLVFKNRKLKARYNPS